MIIRLASSTAMEAEMVQNNIFSNNATNAINANNPIEKEFAPLKPLDEQKHKPLQFPVECLPESLRKYVVAVSEYSQTSSDMAAMFGVGVLAACLQGKFIVEYSNGHHEPVNLYVLVVAPPAERKSSVLQAMTKYIYQYEEKHDCRYIADDCTSEALISIMAKNNGIISVISAEGGCFDILMGRYADKINIDVWLKSHCGDPIHIDRISRKAEHIAHPALTAILATQPEVLQRIMGNDVLAGRGFLARFCYSIPPSKVGQRVFKTQRIPLEIEDDYREMVYRMLDIAYGDKPVILQLSDGAEQMISDLFDKHEKFLRTDGQIISDWAGKYISTVIRISGLLHCANAEIIEPIISGEDMRMAIGIGQYLLDQAEYAYSTMGADINIKKAKFVLGRIKAKSLKSMKRSELHQLCRCKFFRSAEDMQETLELLERYGYIRMEMPQYRGVGRPPDRLIVVNPAIYAM